MKQFTALYLSHMPHTTRWAGQQLGLHSLWPAWGFLLPRHALVRLARAWLLPLLVGLAACQPVPQAPLKVGMSAWVGYDPLALAREQGRLDARQVKLIELSSSSETLRHFRNGLLDAAALTLDETLRLADEGFDVRIVAVLSASAGALREAGYRPIFDSRAMPGDIMDVLVVRGAALASRPDQAAALVAGWQRGLLALQEQPESSAGLLAPGVDLTAGDYLATLNGLRFFTARQSVDLLSGRPKRLGQQAEGLGRTLQAMGLIRDTPDWGRLLVEDVGDRLLTAQEATP